MLDLYAGVGLFAAFLGERVGETGRVVAVEGDRTACEHARGNLGHLRRATVIRAVSTASSRRRTTSPSTSSSSTRRGRAPAARWSSRSRTALPRAVAYVACDPAALARDLATFAEHRPTGWPGCGPSTSSPMTHHVECVALLERT